MIVEFLDEVSIDACNKYSNMDMRVAPSLFLEFSGSPKSLDDNAEIVGKDRALVQFSVPFEFSKSCEYKLCYMVHMLSIHYNFILVVTLFLIG